MSSTSNQGKISLRQEFYQAISSFTPSQKICLFILTIIFVGSLFGIILILNNNFLIKASISGGTLTEGIIGFPGHINPLLAITDPARDLTALIYSGLMKVNSDGKIIPDLADTYSISPDGLIYTFKLKKNLIWQDGQPLTTHDIKFTIQKAQDPNLKSFKRTAWEGITMEIINEEEIHFILKKPYASFLENATLGILPKHLWENIKTEAFALSEKNLKSIGSGPYQIISLSRDSTGLPQSYELKSFKDYALGKPKISTLKIKFYDNEEQLIKAYKKGEIESFSAISSDLGLTLKQDGSPIREIFLPRSFAVFFNQNQTIFIDKNVRQALSLATDKQKIVDDILKGFGTSLDYPIPPGSIGFLEEIKPRLPDPEAAIALLEKNGWVKADDGVYELTNKNKKITRLEFTLSTSNTPELKATASALASQWSKIGAKVSVQIYDLSDLDQNLIRPRKFEALLFGEVLGRNPDLYSFWHSSQRLAPGLNITQYVSATTDKLLEDIRKETDQNIQIEKYKKFQTELAKDIPAIFLYSPSFLYVLPTKIKGALFQSLLTPSERFSNIQNWYINTEKIWKIFTSK